MNIYQLHYFRTMAKVEHYTKAAGILCITQPSLSNAISALEEELGVPLFEKQGRNVVLSRHGKIFLTYVDNALNEIKAGTDKMKELSGKLQVPINIGFIFTLSSYFIPDLIASFKSHEDDFDTEFTLREGNSLNDCTAGLVSDLISDKLDLIFISLLPKDTVDIEFIPLCDQKLVAIIPCDYPLARLSKVDLKDVGPYPFIQFSGKSGLKHEISRLFAKVNILPNICCEVEDEISMAGLVAANMGIAIVPDNPMLDNFKIKKLPIANPLYERKIYIGFMKNRYETLPIQRFKKHIFQKFPGTNAI